MEERIVCFSSSAHTIKEHMTKIKLSFDNVPSFETKRKHTFGYSSTIDMIFDLI